jgi:hypothetical protein
VAANLRLDPWFELFPSTPIALHLLPRIGGSNVHAVRQRDHRRCSSILTPDILEPTLLGNRSTGLSRTIHEALAGADQAIEIV